jgi:hypothetical protein
MTERLAWIALAFRALVVVALRIVYKRLKGK